MKTKNIGVILLDNRFTGAIESITNAINENRDFLTELDRCIGDADHGINMSRGFNAVTAKLKSSPPDSLKNGLKSVAMTLISTVGGASGPLFGTAFLRCSKLAEGKDEVDRELASQMLHESINGIKALGKAEPGDKTMIDALEPACKAFDEAAKNGGTFLSCLKSSCEAAQKGVEYTKTIAAKKGRASYLGERSIGHQDPGATSVTIILKSLTAYYEKKGE